MSFTNWPDFSLVATERGLAPAIVRHLHTTLQVYESGGCSPKVLRWAFSRFAPWAKVVTPSAGDSSEVGVPFVLYPSNLIEDAFICEAKPEICWVYSDRGEGKSFFTYGLAERWLEAAQSWKLSESFGAPRIYVWGDLGGKVPAERGWFRCPDWFYPERNAPGFPLLELYDEVPYHLRSGTVTKEVKVWAERLTRSRHAHTWTIMNMVQARMAAKRGREMDGITVDRHSGIRQLQERLESMPGSPELRALYREIIPTIQLKDPSLVLTQLSREQGLPGTWLTRYHSTGPSWNQERDAGVREGHAIRSAAPWPPDCVKAAAARSASEQLKAAMKRSQEVKDRWAKQLGFQLDDPRAHERASRIILRSAGLQFDAIAEILGGNEPKYRAWNRRNPVQPRELISAGEKLGGELPPRNRQPVLWV